MGKERKNEERGEGKGKINTREGEEMRGRVGRGGESKGGGQKSCVKMLKESSLIEFSY